MATIEQQYLPPPDYETTIAEADRPRIYDAVRKQLGDLLEGDQSYYPDGVQKDWQARADDLDRYIKSFMSSQGRVNDPANILGDVVRYLRAHAEHFRDRMKEVGPSDPIELPPGLSPTTRDRNELYVDPNSFAPPMKNPPRSARGMVNLDLLRSAHRRGEQAGAARRATNILPLLEAASRLTVADQPNSRQESIP